MNNAYEIKNPDFHVSPFTGMTKKHYVECATYLLERAFTYVNSLERPIVFPLVPGKTYPQPHDPGMALSFI